MLGDLIDLVDWCFELFFFFNKIWLKFLIFVKVFFKRENDIIGILFKIYVDKCVIDKWIYRDI